MIDAVHTEFTTDFAIVLAAQEGVDPAVAASFAGSGPGFVRLEAGSKYSRISIRAERWDGRPPAVDGWEDVDDLPFETMSDAGPLMLSGFDPTGVGLDLADFTRGRVRVLARGRHRYHYGSHVDTAAMAPEEWLLQVYPHEGPIDPMAGGPRRIAGEGGLVRPAVTPWHAALLGFRTSGWSHALASSPGFSLASRALYAAAAPVTRVELAMRMVAGLPPWELGGPDAESVPLPAPSSGGAADTLAEISGRKQITTIGDAIDALLSTGLLLDATRGENRVLTPDPSPPPAWERLGLTGAQLVQVRSRALEHEHGSIATTIGYAVRWCGVDGLTSTPRAMAVRWSTTVDDVIGGLRLLGGAGRVVSDVELGFDTELDPDEPVSLRRPEGHDPAFLLVLPHP